MLEFTLEELIVRTGASRRNIKYWTALYALPFRREGRRNFYPEITERLLKGIALLSNHPVFTTAYIRWMIDVALERPAADPERAAALASGWAAVDGAFANTGLIPEALPAFLARAIPPPPMPGTASAGPRTNSPLPAKPRMRDDDALL